MDISWITKVSEPLDYRITAIHSGLTSTVVSPFGGGEQSAMGRAGSRHGMDEFLQLKEFCLPIDVWPTCPGMRSMPRR